jgi:hypothetical protein
MSDAARSTPVENVVPKSSRTRGTVLLLGLALTDFVAHMLVSTNYGYFRDELYYIAAGRHLSLGYVDFPPLIALLARLLDVFADDALWAIHVVPALATALLVCRSGPGGCGKPRGPDFFGHGVDLLDGRAGRAVVGLGRLRRDPHTQAG